MFKVEDEGERISIEVKGGVKTVLTEFAHLVSNLKEDIPVELIREVFEEGLKHDLVEADNEN